MASIALSAIAREQSRGERQTLNDSSDDEDLPAPCRSADNLYRATVHNFRPVKEQVSIRKRGRPTQIAEIEMFLLPEPTDRIPNEREREKLTKRGLGFPRAENAHVFKRNWTIDQINEHICSVYHGHPLALTGFDLAKASKRRELSKLDFDSVKTLKDKLGRGRLFIIPKRRLPNLEDVWADIEYAQGQAETEPSSAVVPLSVQPQTSGNIGDGTEQAVGGENDASHTPGDEVETEQVARAENMAVGNSRRLSLNVNRRMPRTAGSAARQQIRRWAHDLTRRTPGETAESPMVIADDDTQASTSDSITGASVDNQGLTVTEIRQQQDDAYYASLQADQEKERQRQQERQQNEELQLRSQLQQVRARNLPAEPSSNSFILKIRGGPQRRFRAADKVKVLINFVGSVEGVSKDFVITIAGADTKIQSCQTGDETLEQFGINCSAVLEVEWKDEDISNGSVDAYEALMDLLEADHHQEEEETEEELEVTHPSSPSENDLNVVLTMWRSSVLQDDDDCQSLTVTRSPKSLWEHALRCYSRGSFNLKKVLKVSFRNEPGQDEGGLRREFFDTLLRQMLGSSLLEGAGQEYNVTKDKMAFIEHKYLTLGKMVASMFIQGGPLRPIFSHTLISYGIRGLEAATIDTLPEDKQALVERVLTEPMQLLQGDDTIIDAMADAGMHCLLTDQNRSSVSKALILQHSCLKDSQIFMDQFWEGAELLGLRTLLRANKGLVEPLLCGKCGELPRVTADDLVNLLEIDTHGEVGSNSRRLSEEVAQNLESFIYDCEDSKCGELAVDSILRFLTGCTTLPPGGLGKKINVHFTSDERYPSVSTCTLDMTLPLKLSVFEDFRNVMIEAIVSGQGFGII